MEQREIEVLLGVPAQRVSLDQVVSLVLLEPAFQDWLELQDRLVSQVKLDQMDQRVSWDHLDLQGFLDPLVNQVLQGSSLEERRAAQISSVLLTVQQDLRAHKDYRELRDTKDAPVFWETPEASAKRAVKEKSASLGNRASRDLRVQWV